MLFHVIAQLPSSTLESILKLFLLICVELQIRCKSLYFVGDLITYFWCQIHCLLLFLAIWRFLIRTRTLYANFESLEANWRARGRSHPSRDTPGRITPPKETEGWMNSY